MSVMVTVMNITGAFVTVGGGAVSVLVETKDNCGDVSLHFGSAQVAKLVADAINKAVEK